MPRPPSGSGVWHCLSWGLPCARSPVHTEIRASRHLRKLAAIAYDRKGFLAVSAATAFLAACGGSRRSDEEATGATTRRQTSDAAEVLLFHHAQGRTSGFLAFADELRRAGHTVHAPDVYDGRSFDSLDEGLAYAREIGLGEVLERGNRAAQGLPDGLVYAGFSLGAMAAQKLAQTRRGARGALLFHACAPVSEFGPSWPANVPVQIHAMDADPFFTREGDLESARALVASTEDAELFLYPGDQHLFADAGLPSYDADAAALLIRRVLDFLEA